MTTADRRLEIVSVLVVNGHVTSRELAQEFGVARRTILNDVAALTWLSHIHKAGGRRGDFHHGGLQAVQQYAHSLRTGETQKNV